MSGLRDRLLRLRGSSAAEAPESSGSDESSGALQALEPVSEADGKPDSAAEELTDLKHKTENGYADDNEVLTSDWDETGVQIIRTAEGSFLLRESRYPLEHRHGIHRLSELHEASTGLSAFQLSVNAPKPVRLSRKNALNGSPGGMPGANIEAITVKPEKVLFLDLETTGLGVGAGNVPFMVGLGFAEGESFVVQQMLIRHPAEERAMLGYLCEKLLLYSHLITYNGRTFDWPVLLNRFILNGFRTFRWEPVHIDLLHPSRSIWRNTLTSCRLSHVEEERLGIIRTDDVPGSLAPAIYFQFLADGKPGPLLGVFLHNESDMLSLACLAIRFGYLLSGGLGTRVSNPTEPEELLRTGLWLEKMGAAEHAAPLFSLLAEDSHTPASCLTILADRDKKCGNWTRAVLLWQKAVHMAQYASWPDWDAHIELSMYYEHKTKQFDAALALAETALELAQRRYSSMRIDAKRRAELESIHKRVDRLRVKSGRLYG